MTKKRILVSALIGTIALAGLSVSLTLAWYGASDRLSVRPIFVDVAGDIDVKISTSPNINTFSDKVELTPSKEFVFAPVSTLGRTDWTHKNIPEFYDSSFSYASTSGEPWVERTMNGFFQQKIYLMTNLDYYVTLDVNPKEEERENPWSTFKSNTEANAVRAHELKKQIDKNYPTLNVDESEIQDKLDNLINCLRISILVNEENHYNYYIVDPTKERNDVTVFGGRLDNDRDGYYDTYVDENGDMREIVYGEIDDRTKIAYNDPIEDSDFSEEEKPITENFFWNSFEAESSKKAFTYDKDGSSFEFQTEHSLSLEELDSESTELMIPCYANKPTEIVVTFYLEGWDLDCVNSTMGASFEANLIFKLLKGGLV